MTFHFTSENFALTVSLNDRALLVKLFYKNNNCAPIALEKFPTLKGMKKSTGPMIAFGLEKVIQKFENTGSFHLQSDRGRKRVNSTVVEEVATHGAEEGERWFATVCARRITLTHMQLPKQSQVCEQGA
ncbi:UNVERIFIED_CONTAM: hypothetical protein NCL1_25885 [Trichonephila clavipes]